MEYQREILNLKEHVGVESSSSKDASPQGACSSAERGVMQHNRSIIKIKGQGIKEKK